MNTPIPVLLDTDIGSDIDDAVCLAYLLRQQRCELLGITTVTGDTAQRAALAAAVCEAGGRTDVPIHAGCPNVLLTGPGQPLVPQYEAIRNRPHRKDFAPATAVEFLRQTIRARPGAVTLLAIGPLTNIAALFAIDPEIPGLLKGLMLMCGAFTPANGLGPAAREWNAFLDPIATAMVYRARPANFVSIGLDVTLSCVLPAQICRERFTKAGGALGVVGALAEVWFKGRPEIIFHDPLAAACIFEPDLCVYRDGLVSVEYQSDKLFGLTSFDAKAAEKPHRIAAEVNPQRFLEHYFATVGG
jgi:inosine-uridine nucleoside N-ribohydrolase